MSGIELVFFIVAYMVLCFGSVMKTVFKHTDVLAIAEQCVCRTKDFSASHTTQAVSRLGVPEKLGRDITETNQRCTRCHMMLCSATTAEGRRSKGGHLELGHFFFQSNDYT